MLRAMDSAVAGLRAHQNKMDVIGHNIANVNTFGFKSQTYTFKEAMYQTSSPSTGGTGSAGGSNTAQYGYGTLMGSIGVDMTASTPSQASGLNATIDGEGFFITCATKYGIDMTGYTPVSDATIDNTPGTFKSAADWDYTRVGQFLIDSNGYLVDTNNNFVYGYIPKEDGTIDEDNLMPLRVPVNVESDPATGDIKSEFENVNGANGAPKVALKATSVEINKMGEVTATVTAMVRGADGKDVETSFPGVSLGKVAIVTFQNPNGLTKAGNGYYKASDTDNTGAVSADVPGGEVASLMPGYIEASNVDLAKEFAEMITTHRGFQANSKMITVSDEMLSDLVSMKR